MRERILGNGGDDILFGGGGDDRLEGGDGTDQALFTDVFINYDWTTPNSSNPAFEFNHTRGGQSDGKDTTKDIEFGTFEFVDANKDGEDDDGNLFFVPLQVDPDDPTKLKDGALIHPKEKVLDDEGEEIATMTVESPAWMFDGDVKYNLSIGLDTTESYNIAFIVDRSGSMAGGLADSSGNIILSVLTQTKDALTQLIDSFEQSGIDSNIDYSVIAFSDGPARLDQRSGKPRRFTAGTLTESLGYKPPPSRGTLYDIIHFDTQTISIKMYSLEYKVKPVASQIQAIEEAIKTTQFVRNKVLRFWMDNRGVGKTEMFRHNTFLRAEYSFVKELNSHACQTAVERVLRAVNRFFDKGLARMYCKKNVRGKKGYPRFVHNTRSVEYKTSGWKLQDCRKRITFTDKKNIGTFKLIGSRNIYFYQSEQIKRVRILKRADGYYVQFSIKIDPRDTVEPISPSQKAIGIDVGLKYFYADSQGSVVENPRFYRSSERQLNRANRQKSKKFVRGQKQSNNYLKARQRYALKHLKVSRQREEFAKRVALRLIQSNDLIVCEDLNIKGLVKNRCLSKSTKAQFRM